MEELPFELRNRYFNIEKKTSIFSIACFHSKLKKYIFYKLNKLKQTVLDAIRRMEVMTE